MTPSAQADRLIVALDVSGYDEAAKLVDKLRPRVHWFKIGSVLFTREGPKVCRLIKNAGAKLFLDLKFHDIPNTVRGAVTSALQLDADMLTVHLSGGEAMARAAARAKADAGRPQVMIVGVTVLTHLTFDDFHSLYGTDRSSRDTMLFFAGLAQRVGLDGVVASANELPLIRSQVDSGFKVVTPGIRLAAGSRDDQTRVVTPKQAVRDGADYLVVGRPITAATDPVEACRNILRNMAD